MAAGARAAMRRGEAWKPLREHGGWMRLSERAVFMALLERSDNSDCTIPVNMTPSLVQLAESCCCSKSTAAAALDHLERHAWITRTRISNPGRGHKTTYQLQAGGMCDCPSAPAKESDSRTLSNAKGSDSRTVKGSDSHPETRTSTAVSDEGITEGGNRKGVVARPVVRAAANGHRQPPDWLLIKQIVRIVHTAPGGGLHRQELAEKLQMPAEGPSMREALGIAYRRRQIDFCRQYVVKPPERKTP